MLGQIETEYPAPSSSDTHGNILGSFLAGSFSSDAKAYEMAMPIARDKTASTNAVDAGTWDNPMYFPHGGYIIMNLDSSISATSVGANTEKFSGLLSGVWEIQATCNYVPE